MFSSDLTPYRGEPRIRFAVPLMVALLFSLTGCSQQPSPPVGPSIEVSAAAAEVFDQFDLNKSGDLDTEELARCPALFAAKERLDGDGNHLLSHDEVKGCLYQIVNSDTVLVDAIAEVSMDGRPLSGAMVTLEPESFMGESYKTVSAVTDGTGVATFSGHDPKLPGVYLGFYRVRISKEKNGKETIPVKYNSTSELGIELATGKSNIAQFTL